MVIEQLDSSSTLTFSRSAKGALGNIYLSPDNSMFDLFSKLNLRVLTLEDQIINTSKGVKRLLTL